MKLKKIILDIFKRKLKEGIGTDRNPLICDKETAKILHKVLIVELMFEALIEYLDIKLDLLSEDIINLKREIK